MRLESAVVYAGRPRPIKMFVCQIDRERERREVKRTGRAEERDMTKIGEGEVLERKMNKERERERERERENREKERILTGQYENGKDRDRDRA